MEWQVGQKLKCERPEQTLTGCTVQDIDAATLTVVCPSANIVICGQQPNLELFGWQPDDASVPLSDDRIGVVGCDFSEQVNR